MAVTMSVGRLLLNNAIPEKHRRLSENASKGDIKRLLTTMAKDDPRAYTAYVTKMKRTGDQITTDLGVTVGLDDIEPDYKRRDAIMRPAMQRIKNTTSDDARRRIIDSTQDRLLEATRKHPGQMTMMATSGARGAVSQLMRTVSSPTGVVDANSNTVPWLVNKSFSEGLSAPDTWAEMAEARRNVVESNLSVSEPGTMGKLYVNTMQDQLVTMPDCGTHNGIIMAYDDPNLVDRYLAKTNELVTPFVADRLRKTKKPVLVRSPMTCEAPSGVCQHCQGLDEKGNIHTIGTNVGMRAAQALTEPLTQMALNAKHAVRTNTSPNTTLRGLGGVKQLIEVPQSFPNQATLSTLPGRVTRIERAPQGGHYVHVESTSHYIPPSLSVNVLKGKRVIEGDVLSTGIPRPDEIVKYRGLGAGRQYLVDKLYDVYAGSGTTLDKRHLELLAKADLNYIKITGNDSADLGAMHGDVLDYNTFRSRVASQSKDVKVSDTVGSTLGGNVLHYTAGTRITPQMAREFHAYGFKKVPVAPRLPTYEPIMKPIAQTPLLNPDVLARLAHRNLKRTITEGAAFGQTSDIHSTNPMPAFIYGAEFGSKANNRY